MKLQRPEPAAASQIAAAGGRHQQTFPAAAGQKKRVTRKAQSALANDLDPDDLVSLGLRGSNAGVETLLREDDEEEVVERVVRFRTVGDMSCTAAVLSEAGDISSVVQEIRESSISERGARIDDKRSEAAMEKRKQQGYF